MLTSGRTEYNCLSGLVECFLQIACANSCFQKKWQEPSERCSNSGRKAKSDDLHAAYISVIRLTPRDDLIKAYRVTLIFWLHESGVDNFHNSDLDVPTSS